MKVNTLAITSLFLVITIAGSLKIAGTLGYYALFTEDFVERFCENKERPELQCNGKCALSKMLAKKKQEERKPLNLDWLKTETILFLETLSALDFKVFSVLKRVYAKQINLYNFRFVPVTIIPPRY